MNNEALQAEWITYGQMKFEGWDFSLIEDQWENEVLPWDYTSIVRTNLTPDLELLDMGTGGGEFLSTLHHPHEKTSVTEGWQPNIELLKRKFVPLGIQLAPIGEDDVINYKDHSFDIITNRHESFRIDEVKRVLKPSGLFITQQAGGENGNRLSNLLIPNFQPQFKDLNLKNTVAQLKENGFHVIFAEEYFPNQKFFTMKALIYYASVIKWEFPGFDVEEHFDRLLHLYKELTKNGYIINKEHRFIIVATR